MKRVIIDLGFTTQREITLKRKFDELSIISPDENNRNVFNPFIQT